MLFILILSHFFSYWQILWICYTYGASWYRRWMATSQCWTNPI